MATPKVMATPSDSWVDVIGAAAGVAGMTWQCTGNAAILIAFTTVAPAGSPTDAVHQLNPGDAYYDKNGSAHIWTKRMAKGNAQLSGTAD